MSKRCVICDISSVGSLYQEGIEDNHINKITFTDDGNGNDLCLRCADIIQNTLSEMEVDDE